MARVSTYLSFARETEAAFLFYQSVFGGDFVGPMRRYSDLPATSREQPLAPDDGHLIVHVELPILGGHLLMGTDAPVGFQVIPGNQVHIMLEPDTRAETDRLFEALGVNGTSQAAPREMPWGGYFASLTDQFGVNWLFNCRG